MKKRLRLFLYLLFLFGSVSPPLLCFKDNPVVLQWFVCCGVGLLILLLGMNDICFPAQSSGNRTTDWEKASLVFLAAFGILLLLQIHSGSFYDVTRQPTVWSLTLCLLLPYILAGAGNTDWKNKLPYAVVAVLCALLVLKTGSRTGVLCLSFFLISFIADRIPRRSRIIRVVGLLCIVLLATALIARYKHDSSLGRYFILGNSIELIKESPLAGLGDGGFLAAYMQKQCVYFQMNPDSRFAMLADDIRHPLNEFIYWWINYGIMGFLLLVLLFAFPAAVFLRRHMKTDFRVVCAIGLFASFSQPFNYPLPCLFLAWAELKAVGIVAGRPLLAAVSRAKTIVWRVSLAFFIIAQICLGCSFAQHACWNRAAYIACRGGSRAALPVFAKHLRHFENNPYYLYDYMSALYRAGEFGDAMAIYKRLCHMLSSYNLELLAGDTCSHLQRFDEAADHYKTAMFMCPCRFAPLEGLYNVYEQTGDDEKKRIIADEIARKTVKVPSEEITRIKYHCR
ncbi:MAG: O-antigen ligase family protein [Bacteroidales bacterium]|nr:O-antigen ligase family protein [Bacteroidales bacterium]